MTIASRLAAVSVTVVFSLGLAACSRGGDVASVNGQKISRAEFDAKIEAMPQAKGVLNQMAQGIMIEQYAHDNKVTVSNDEIKKREDEIKARYPAGQFEQILKAQNLTEADVQRILRQQLIVEKAVAPSVTLSDAEIKAYLDKNHPSLDTAAQVRARHILVADEKKANLVEAKLHSGSKFEEMAKQYSTDPSTKDKGGELGFFNATQMVPAFSKAAFSQQVGAIGPPVKSPFGYHIIQVEEKKPAQVATLANSSDKIRTLLTQQRQQQQIPAFLAQLRAKADIKIFDPALQGAIPSPPPSAAPAASAPAKAPVPVPATPPAAKKK